MPWGEMSIMSLRLEFVMLARQAGANFRALCWRFGVQPRIGYKWLERYAAEGKAGLADRSRRPKSSPGRTSAALEAKIVSLRRAHPCWGGRKLRRRLEDLGARKVPSPSTITAIVRRHGLIDADEAARHTAFRRFERALPNELLQMDFKGHFPLAGGARCHPLTVLDDHSRFALVLAACGDERGTTVRARLSEAFGRYGLPMHMLMDNGSPWGGGDPDVRFTPLTVWLMLLGITTHHGRPFHPQTQGKDERFHRTLKAEAIGTRSFGDLGQCQATFDAWRHVYNFERPHQALDLAVPASRYRPSPRTMPTRLGAPEYAPGEIVRKVQQAGWISYRNRSYRVGKAFRGYAVALRPTAIDGELAVCFAHQRIAIIDLRTEPDE